MDFEGRLSVTPPSTYNSPLTCTGLKRTGTQHDANIAGINGPAVKYSAFPFVKFVAVTVSGILRASKLSPGISLMIKSRSPSMFTNPVHVQAGRNEEKKRVLMITSKIFSGVSP